MTETGPALEPSLPERSLVQRAVEAYRVNSSAAAAALLVLFNLVPLAGVLWLGWDLFLILALYWVENGVVGVINILKILSAQGKTLWTPGTTPISVGLELSRPVQALTRLGTAGFFCVHYGLFWVVHGVFVLIVVPAFTGDLIGPIDGTGGTELTPLAGPDIAVLAVGTIGLGVSHGVSFWSNYIGRREYLTLSPSQVMAQPYSRLVILHLTILLGAFVSIFLGTPVGSLLVLIVLKTALDLFFHLRQHRSTEAAPRETL